MCFLQEVQSSTDVWNEATEHIQKNSMRSMIFSFDIIVLNEKLHQWQAIYNTVRPNQAIGYLTPLEYITQWKQQGGCVRDVLN